MLIDPLTPPPRAGEDGEDGPQGPKGDKGDKGDKGAPGELIDGSAGAWPFCTPPYTVNIVNE